MLYVKVIWCNAISYNLLSIGVEGNMYPQYMILLYSVTVRDLLSMSMYSVYVHSANVKFIWCNCIADIYCQFGGGDVSSVYVVCDSYLV